MNARTLLAWLVALLPSVLRCAEMRARGHDIGKNVRLGRGSLITGQHIRIADGVVIGRSVAIAGESVCIAAETRIGNNTRISARKISIGRDCIITSDVHIGGFTHPESAFVMGSNSIIMYHTHIDTSRAVHIGNDVGVGGHCLLFTHSSWMNRYLGYPVTFAPLFVADGAWLPWRVFVLPGASIGQGSLIGANSLVSGDIPSRVLAVGSPAKVVRSLEPKPVDQETRRSITTEILGEFAEVLRMKGHVVRAGGRVLHVGDAGTSDFNYRVLTNDPSEVSVEASTSKDLIVGIVQITALERVTYFRRNAFWLDVVTFERSSINSEAARQLCAVFLRHGVRFTLVDAMI